VGKVNKKLSGNEGEELAVNYLAGLGYKILHRNFRAGRKEIDIVALDGTELVFVEVKAGKSKEFGEPELRVDERKQKNLAEVAQKFLVETKVDFESCRFDVLGVDLKTKKIVHYRGAFLLPEQD
jgi:putative endonuclease